MEHANRDTTISATFNGDCHPEEVALVSAAQSGAVSAFNELCNIYSKPLYGIAFHITKNREDAEDALQDSLLRAYVALKNFQGRSSLYTWLTRIAINSSLMILRKRKVRRESSLFFPSEMDEELELAEFKDGGPDPEQRFEECQRHLKLLEAIERLARPLHDIIELRMKRDCTTKQAAQILNISQAAAKSRMFRAQRRLRRSRDLKDLARTGERGVSVQ